jgi:hypothetical protein
MSVEKKFKNRSERNEGVKTDALIIFEGKQLLTKRPETMTTDEYKFTRKTQELILKELFRRCPDRGLQGIIPSARNSGFVRKGVTKRVVQRKAS